MWSLPNSCIWDGILAGAPLPTPQPQSQCAGKVTPVQVKEHSVIHVNGSILVGLLHPAVFDIKFYLDKNIHIILKFD